MFTTNNPNKRYYNELTGEIITETEFRMLALDYINNNEWEDGGKPSVYEVMINMDYINEI